MSQVSLARQLEAVTLAHQNLRGHLAQLQRLGKLTPEERELKFKHGLALRAARDTLARLVEAEAAGAAMPPLVRDLVEAALRSEPQQSRQTEVAA